MSVGSQAVMAHPACPLQQATQPASYRAKAATLARAPVSRAVKPTTPAAKTPVLANRQVLGADKSTALQDHTCAITVNAINATAQQCGAASANVQHGKLSGNVEVSAKCHAALTWVWPEEVNCQQRSWPQGNECKAAAEGETMSSCANWLEYKISVLVIHWAPVSPGDVTTLLHIAG